MSTYVPNDPLYGQQWHIGYIGRLGSAPGSAQFNGIERVWADHRGSGVTVGVWDSGTQWTHWDLDGNYVNNPITVGGATNNGREGPPGTDNTGAHGTAVAGLIAAENNGAGGVGIAFQSSLTAYRVIQPPLDAQTADPHFLGTIEQRLHTYDITNHSYGLNVASGYGPVTSREADFLDSLSIGRNGLGTLNFWATGNNNWNSQGEQWGAQRGVIAVAALNQQTQAASYSNYGSNVLVSAPAGLDDDNSQGVTTVDWLGVTGFSASGPAYSYLNGDYTSAMNGTSSASPISAAVAALMLDANPNLGWRDVQNILAYSSVGVGSMITGSNRFENGLWSWNGSNNWNGGGLHYSPDYGYGMVNAYNAVRMAEAWNFFGPSKTSANEQVSSFSSGTINVPIPDLGTQTRNFTLGTALSIENVEVTLTLTHSFYTDMRISLIAPSGVSYMLADGSNGGDAQSDFGFTYTFGVVGLRGTTTAGNWQLVIQDVVSGDAGTLHSFSMRAFGTTDLVNDVYHYTEEVISTFAFSGQAGRVNLADTDGGTDWINAAAMVRELNLNLNQGQTSTVGGQNFITIQNGTVIENAYGGDGNDMITGNGANNTLVGARGNDTLLGGAGVDIFYGGAGNDTIWYSPEDGGIDAGPGFDTARAVTNDGLAIRMDMWSIEQLFAGNGNDNIFTFGTAAYNVDGGGGNDSISGNVFGDVLGGNTGNDVIVGFAGNDTLGGGAGSDRLMGMEGADTLFGEGDPDSYIYRGLIDAGDTIIGFETAAARGVNGDKLEIQRAGFMNPSQWNAGALDPNRFVAGPATLATGQFLFDTNTGRLFWDGDGTGAGFAQLLLTVQGVNNLTAADFVLV